MKRLKFIVFPLLILICFISGCKFDFLNGGISKNASNNSSKTTTKKDEKVLNYHVVGLSEYDTQDLIFYVVEYSNKNYDEILNQRFDVPGYNFVGLFTSDTPKYEYDNKGRIKYSNLLKEEDIFSGVDIYIILSPITYKVIYSNDFVYESRDSLDYYTYARYDRVHGIHPLEPKNGWYDFDGEWTISLYDNPSKTFSSIDEFLKSHDGYGDIVIRPNATLKDIKKTGTISLDGQFDDVEFEFMTGNTNEVDVESFLESLNFTVPEKDGYTTSFGTESIVPIEYTNDNLVIDVIYTPIEYTINFSYDYTGNGGAHIFGNNEIKYTVEDDDIVLADNNYLDQNSKKVLKVDYWIDTDKNERIDVIDTSSIQNYNLSASVSPIIYTIEEFGYISNLPYDKEFASITEYIGMTAKIAEKTLSIDDFNASGALNLYSLYKELRNLNNSLTTYRTGNDEVNYKNEKEDVQYTFNSKKGYEFSYKNIDETSTTIKLYFDNFAFGRYKNATFNLYINGRIYRTDSYTMTEVMKGEIDDYRSDKTFRKQDYSNLFFDAYFNSMKDALNNEIGEDFDFCTYLIDYSTINVLYDVDTYEIEYVVPEGWENTNQTSFSGDTGYYLLSNPTSLSGKGRFYGWTTSPDSTEYVTRYCTCDYKESGEIVNNPGVAGKTITKLFAITEEPKAEVTMHYGNGIDSTTTYIFKDDNDIVIDYYYKDDYRIKEWYYDQDLTQILTDNTIIIENATGVINLYPKWEFCGYVMTFKSKFDDINWDYSEAISQYYTQKGFITEQKNDLVYLFYGIDDPVDLPTLSYPGNNKESIYAWIGKWIDTSTSDRTSVPGGAINTKLLNRYMNNSPILELDVRVYTKEYDSTFGRKVVKLRTTSISRTTNGANIEEVTKAYTTSKDRETSYLNILAAMDYFGITNVYLKVDATFNCTKEVIPELYIAIGDADYTNSSYWQSTSDSNAYSGNYKKLNVSLSKNGNTSGIQTLSLYTSLTTNPDSNYHILLSQHNSRYASGGYDVYNPKINVNIDIIIYGY